MSGMVKVGLAVEVAVEVAAADPLADEVDVAFSEPSGGSGLAANPGMHVS